MKKEKIKFSFEFFPANTPTGEISAWNSLKQLEQFKPEFFSVTFGAGGGERLKTDSFVKKINKLSSIPVAGHLTCVDMSKDEINDIALSWHQQGVKKIVALRGYVRTPGEKYKPHPNGYLNAADMVFGLKRLANFEIAVGGYPEKHPDSKNIKADIDNIKSKVDAGADKIITQYFFESETFLRYRDLINQAGIKVPLIPGIMPISSYKKVKNFSDKCGTTVPTWVEEQFTKIENNPELEQLTGINIASNLINQLNSEGVNEFHFYTLNKYELSFALCNHHRAIDKNVIFTNEKKTKKIGART